jgi:hypothetical protein
MQVETLRDVLHWTKEFHQHLSQCLSQCAGKNIDERAQMLLNYLSDHEKSLTKVISGFETSGDEHALNTWCYEYIQKHPIIRHVHCDAPFAELDAKQIMEVIADQHQQVIELYRHLASQAVIPSAIELLKTLRSLEEHESMRMTHTANRFDDM